MEIISGAPAYHLERTWKNSPSPKLFIIKRICKLLAKKNPKNDKKFCPSGKSQIKTRIPEFF